MLTMQLTQAGHAHRTGRRIVPNFVAATILAATIPFAALLPGGALAAPEGKTKSVNFAIIGGSGFNGPIRVVSDDGEKWTRIKPDTSITFQASTKIEMKRSGKIKQYGIFWGSCSGHGCLQSSVHPLMFSKGVDDAKSINKFDIFDFPTAKIPDNVLKTYAVPPPMHFGFYIIDRCNAALSQGKTIHDSHGFTTAIPVTLGFDTGITKDDFDQAVSGDGPHPLHDVDHSRTVNVVLGVVCEPAPETVKAPPKILEADFGVTTSGNTCPKPSTARVIIAAESPRAVFYKIERADGTTTTADWIQGEIKIQNDLMGGKSPWMHAEHALDKLDPGTSKFRLEIDGWGKTPWRTVNVECPPFEVISAWLKFDIEDKATCPKKVVETATFYTTRPGMVDYEIKHQGGLVVHSGQVQAKRQGDQYIAIATRNLTIKEPFKADMMAVARIAPPTPAGCR
jgi:hypothetical protein